MYRAMPGVVGNVVHICGERLVDEEGNTSGLLPETSRCVLVPAHQREQVLDGERANGGRLVRGTHHLGDGREEIVFGPGRHHQDHGHLRDAAGQVGEECGG